MLGEDKIWSDEMVCLEQRSINGILRGIFEMDHMPQSVVEAQRNVKAERALDVEHARQPQNCKITLMGSPDCHELVRGLPFLF